MNDFFSIIGTIASIGSIPLSVYLYIKSKENSIDKVKREVVKILSHQIGDRRKLTTFEIQTVINSKARDAKINTFKISVNEIIEDLVSETISNPLLDKTIKESIIAELKGIYFKGEVLVSIDKLEINTRPENELTDEAEVEAEIKNIINRRKSADNSPERKINERKRTFSDFFGKITVGMTIIATLTILLGKENVDNLNEPFLDFLRKNDFYIGLTISLLTALIGLLVSYITWKASKNKS